MDSCRIFVANLPKDLLRTNDDPEAIVLEHFAKCAPVREVDLQTYTNFRGFGFVTFHSAQAASELVQLSSKFKIGSNLVRFSAAD